MRFKLTTLLVLLVVNSGGSTTWGFYGHKRINELAVYTLPDEMFGFYKKHVDFLIEHSVDPDKRRYGVEGEAQRHFIDIDYYCKGEPHCNPFNLVPRRWYDAVAKYSEDTLQAYGIVPWHIPMMKERLTKAFIDKDVVRILRTSAELGHYVADAHVPLHTTENYNGQMTNQNGIHGFWESRLPELFSEDYDFFVGKAKYSESPLNFAWDFVEDSHNALDSVLNFEKQLNESFPKDQKYSFEERGRAITQVYSAEYSQAYHNMLNGQVERRMKSAVIDVGSLWYTAWVDAGQPNLDELLDPDMEKVQEEIISEIDVPEKNDLKKRTHDN
ncbi:MAG: S1/P1 Nuclease [Cryomorphaceae bacterium]|nr:S1/P1 Nuclease [Cryomorphaceae bacterium]